MALSDNQIIQRIDDGSLTIEPFIEGNVEPASVDLRLGADAKLVEEARSIRTGESVLDTRQSQYEFQYKDIVEEDSFVIFPDEFVLATTAETIALPNNLLARVTGRSSLGRLGIAIHQTAGYIDPGFHGQITLELVNNGPSPVRLYTGDRVCQIIFAEVSGDVLEPYGHTDSQYQGQTGATPSGMNFE